MLRKIFLLSVVFTFWQASAFPKAVAFRYDDNQRVEICNTLADVFRRNGVRFSMALVPFHILAKDAQWRKTVCALEDEGFEVMNHTPWHNTLSFLADPNDPLLKKAAKSSGVDHVSGRMVYLKFDAGKTRYGKEFKVRIHNKNKISGSPQLKDRLLLKIRDKFYYTFPRPGKKGLYLRSIWSENNVDLPDEENVPVQICSPAFVPAPGSYEFLVEAAHEGFRRIGLKKVPKVWIQPGGYYPLMEREALGKVLKKYGYVSSSSFPRGYKGFNDPDADHGCFAMDWGDFNLRTFDVKRAKFFIAEAVACHRTAICASHVEPARKGKLKEYAAAIDALLKWLKQSGIKVVTQSELAGLLAQTTADPGKNIFPSLSCDLDGDGMPDGYRTDRSVTFKNGTASLGGRGRMLFIQALCGLPRGKAQLSLEHQGVEKGEIVIRYYDSLRRICGSQKFVLKSGRTWEKSAFVLNIPAKCAALSFEFFKNSAGKAQVRCLQLKK